MSISVRVEEACDCSVIQHTSFAFDFVVLVDVECAAFRDGVAVDESFLVELDEVEGLVVVPVALFFDKLVVSLSELELVDLQDHLGD